MTPTEALAALRFLELAEKQRRRTHAEIRAVLLSCVNGGQSAPPPSMRPSVAHDDVVALLLDTAETGKALNISPRSVQRLVNNGELASVKVGGATRFRTCDVLAYVARLGDEEMLG